MKLHNDYNTLQDVWSYEVMSVSGGIFLKDEYLRRLYAILLVM